MAITMVKKRLANGQPCKKCAQAEDMLKRRGLWELIDQVVIADENDPESAGMALGRKHAVDLAPFFIIEAAGTPPEVFTSVIKFAKALAPGRAASSGAALANNPSSSSGTQAAASTVKRESPEDANLRLIDASPQDILLWGLERYGTDCAIAFSGAEDVAVIDMASQLGLPFSVFSLDTGRLHPETYRFMDMVREHFGVEIEWYSPEPRLLEPFVRKKGLFSFLVEGHAECCQIRKVEPLGRALAGRKAWISGRRRDQSPTRTDLDVIERDDQHADREGEPLVKLNPLANWSGGRVWQYIREQQLPYNELHDRGFVSIGCEPCTRAVGPGEHERAGRWWWEEETKRECGLHRG